MQDDLKTDARILVIDDDKELADMLVDYLTRLGYETVAASSGREGLEIHENSDLALVLLDLNMPGMSGLQVLEKIKEQNKQITVVMITGFGTIESAVAAIKAGAYDFITKPFELKNLEVVVDRAMERYTLMKQRSVFRGVAIALLLSIPIWLVLGIVIARSFL